MHHCGGVSAFGDALDFGIAIGDGINLSRDISVEPPNLLTPTTMADRARAMAQEAGLEFEVLDRDRMAQLGMGALLGVSQGSAEPPAMIVMHYKPEKAESSAHLGLIGKGVTFDTGGISIKPSEGMEKMKYDMAGGAFRDRSHVCDCETEAFCGRNRDRARSGKYARRQGATSGRHCDFAFREDD